MASIEPRRIVDLNAYREARARKALPLFEGERAPVGQGVSPFRHRTPLTARGVAHRARMLEHFTLVSRQRS